jgi:hypothetical protein
MKLRTLTATFGKLSRQTLELGEGLNLIEAPNEAGKSTWAAFLRAMLYGIDTRERDKKGFLAEKNRYQPWAGSPMEGEAQLCWRGREITLRRSSRAGAPLGVFQAVYTGTEEPVPGLAGDTAGELLTGVGREVFERSAFLGQGAMAVTGSAELERRIGALVSSGQEDVSFSEAQQRLRDWRNRRRSNQKNGLIPRLEEEQAQLRDTLERLEGAARLSNRARAEIAQLEAQRAQLEAQARGERDRAAAQAKARYEKALAERDQAQAALDEVRRERRRRGTPPDQETLHRLQGELAYQNTLDANIRQARKSCEEMRVPSLDIPHPVFRGMEPAAAKERGEADAEKVRELTGELKRALPMGHRLLVVGVFLCAIAAVVLIDLLLGVRPALFGAVCGGALAALAAVVVWGRAVQRKTAARVRRLLEAYGAQGADEITRQAQDYADQWEAASQTRTEAAVRAVTLERLEAERSELTERLLDSVHPFAPEVTDLFGVSAAVSLALNLEEKERTARLRLEGAEKVLQATEPPGAGALPAAQGEAADRLRAVQSELSQWSERLAMAQGEQNTLGDPAALQARLEEVETQLTRRREELAALTAAMDAMDQANAQLQERLSPALNRRAGELLSRLTGGAYDQVSLTRQFEALARGQGDVNPHTLLELSRGTADQVYLAVRLAVCQLALAGDDPAPLVLDDALVAFDDHRLSLALDLLQELSAQRQILLFTCQSRERQALSGRENVRVIGLQS